MARIKVKLKDGRKGSIEENEFDSSLMTRDYGTLGNIVEKLPVGMATVAGAATIPAGLGIPGAAAGYGGGYVLRDLLRPLYGAERPEPAKNVGDALVGSAMAGTTASIPQAAYASLPLLPYILSRNKTGGKIEQLASNAGTVPAGKLEEKFGTARSPNPKIFQGQASASREPVVRAELGKEIAGQGQTATGSKLPGTTYTDLLNYRKGAYTQGFDKTAPRELQGLYKNIGSTYSDILHEDVPNMAKFDKLYSLQSKPAEAIKDLPKLAPRAAFYYLMYKLMGKIF